MRKKICFNTWGREAAYGGKKKVLLCKNGIAQLDIAGLVVPSPHEENCRAKRRLSVPSESMVRDPSVKAEKYWRLMLYR